MLVLSHAMLAMITQRTSMTIATISDRSIKSKVNEDAIEVVASPARVADRIKVVNRSIRRNVDTAQ
jgi:hypothetical protein